MVQITKGHVVYNVPDDMPQDIVKMLLETDSMNAQEKQYWFDVYPTMTGEQRERLRDILETEKRKLAELKKKSKKDMDRIRSISIQ